MQQYLIIILILLILLLGYSYKQKEEGFEIIYPYYPKPMYTNIVSPYYWPTNCMETLFNGIKCFPFLSYWPTFSYPYYY